MYQIGSFLIHENAGICKVKDISMHRSPKEKESHLYYTLQPLYQQFTIYTPVDNSKIFLRPVISKKEAEHLIDKIPSIQAEPCNSKATSQLTQHYQALLKTHNCEDLIELTKSLHTKKQEVEDQNRKFGAIDEKFMKRAEELLFGELSVALGIPKDDVPEYITSRVDALVEDRVENNGE
jgi:CarD family transcriptional regulator